MATAAVRHRVAGYERKAFMSDQKKLSWKKMARNGIFALVFVCLIVFLIFESISTGKKSPETKNTVTLNLVYAYQNAQWHQGIQTIAEAFMQEHEEIHINTQVQYEDKVYEDVLYKLQARDELGDIVQLKTPERYAREGLLTPIDDRFGELLEGYATYEDKIYGVEAIGSASGIVYNRAIFEKYGLSEPKDYGEFLHICDILKNHGVTPVGIAGGDLWHMEFWVNHFLHTDILYKDPDWLQKRGADSVHWTDPEPLAMLAHLKQLFDNGYVNEDWAVMKDGNLSYAMSQGEMAMIYTGSWTARELQKQGDGISLGWFFVPDEEGNVIISQNQDVYWSLTKACGADPEKYAAAISFLEYFYSPEVYAVLCQDTYGFPVTKEKADYTETDIQLEIKNEFCTEDTHISDYIGNDDTPQGFEKSMLKLIQTMAAGETTIKATAQQLDELWTLSGISEGNR